MAQPQTPVIPPSLNLPLFNAAGDQLDYTLYDRLQLNNAGGAVEREFFAVGLGETDSISARRKTLADTNVRGGRIPEGQASAIYALKIWYESGTDAKTEAERVALRDWVHEATIEFKIESKNNYGIWKLSELQGMADDMIVTAGATGQAFESAWSTFQGIKKFNLYIPLPRLTEFRVVLDQGIAPDAAFNEDYICCGLVGILNRAG